MKKKRLYRTPAQTAVNKTTLVIMGEVMNRHRLNGLMIMVESMMAEFALHI
jgi:hypothetical protein